MIGQPVKKLGELLQVLVDSGRALARVQQPILALNHLHFPIFVRRSIPHRFDKGAEIVLLVADLFRCPGEGLLFQIAVTQGREEWCKRFDHRCYRLDQRLLQTSLWRFYILTKAASDTLLAIAVTMQTKCFRLKEAIFTNLGVPPPPDRSQNALFVIG